MERNNKSFEEVIVVEGYHDLAKLRSIYPNIDIEITNGSTIDVDRLEKLRILNEKRGLILFLDPDFQGERIRKIINDYVGNTKHAFLKKHQCISKNKKKVGIEHASSKDIIEGLNNLLTASTKIRNLITIQDLYNLKLIGNMDSKQKRKDLGEDLGIGLNNGKTLLNKLNMFNFDLATITQKIKGD